MSNSKCPATITITSQDDIRNASLAPCTGAQGFNELVIKTSADGLGFTNFTGGFNITVSSSPSLQILSFPDLVALDCLNISSAPALTQISMPKLEARAKTLVYPVTYTFTPSISIADALRFGGLSFPALDELTDLVIRHVPRRQTISGGLARIASAGSIESDNYLNYPGLASVGALRLTGYKDATFFLPNLTSVAEDFVFTNAAGSKLQTASGLKVDGSFMLNTATYPRASNESKFDTPPPVSGGNLSANVIDVGNLTSVGVNATIRSIADARIDISGLTTVGGTLSISNNTNCTIDVTKLAQVRTLSIVDNVDSAIPQLFNLARAESIHLRGNIDTSSGPNILPSLTFVSGSVTIEPWNADFNCSRLIAQQQQGLINNLSCNGTSSSSLSPSPSSPSSSSSDAPDSSPGSTGLSTSAQAGIGVGVSVVVIALVGGAIWLFLYFRRRFAALEASAPLASHPQPPPSFSAQPAHPLSSGGTASATTTLTGSGNGMQERGGREREPEIIHEADPSTAILEKPTPLDVSHELFVPPAELPVTYPRHHHHHHHQHNQHNHKHAGGFDFGFKQQQQQEQQQR